MDRVYRGDEQSVEGIRSVAIAISQPRPNQRHTGILYREVDTEPVMMLDLRWHHDLQSEVPDPNCLWADPSANATRLAHVAAMCRLVWKGNQTFGIPYGFSSPIECFDEQTGRFLLGPTGFGLTCATFVLAVFHRVGLPLVDYESWPSNRPGDSEWQQNIVELLRRTQGPSDHIASVEGDIGSVRFRPEEVAGAATVSPLPSSFAEAAMRGEQILELLASPHLDHIPAQPGLIQLLVGTIAWPFRALRHFVSSILNR